jgi:hypothetical protein
LPRPSSGRPRWCGPRARGSALERIERQPGKTGKHAALELWSVNVRDAAAEGECRRIAELLEIRARLAREGRP